jgi:hypothetical protein
MFIAAGAGGCSELLLLLLGVGGRPGADGNSVCSLLFGEARVGEEGFGDEGGNRKHNNNGRCVEECRVPHDLFGQCVYVKSSRCYRMRKLARE